MYDIIRYLRQDCIERLLCVQQLFADRNWRTGEAMRGREEELNKYSPGMKVNPRFLPRYGIFLQLEGWEILLQLTGLKLLTFK